MTDSSPTPELEEKKQLARRIPEDVLTEGNLDLLNELYTEDAVEHTPSGDVEGRAGLQKVYEGFRTAFPDVSLTVEDIVAEGDSVAMRLVVQGTHEGEFMGGIEPTGQEFEVQKWAHRNYTPLAPWIRAHVLKLAMGWDGEKQLADHFEANPELTRAYGFIDTNLAEKSEWIQPQPPTQSRL